MTNHTENTVTANVDALKLRIISALASEKKIPAVIGEQGAVELRDGSYGAFHFDVNGEYVGATRTVKTSVQKFVWRIIESSKAASK